ncbi:hypothetical protein RQP53_11010 [Paucibacter sp. APW11]|uniref:Response regulatory domain-containing protein n=1 Tax=Roseateles aquae TaxID=3077235 RepID=A0ABU3PB53_9BURK|nr:hypothetical protein [Paucibacter sp. APW11]MDT8999798.1 hypothetical protein [Paucibacter sp. APW11]
MSKPAAPEAKNAATAHAAAAVSGRLPGQEPGQAQWAEIVQQLGAEIAGPLSTAMERIHNLVVTGQIDRQSLRSLRESVAQAREAGMLGQQLARLASGRLRLSNERLHLTQMLRGVLAHRSRETQARGIQVRQVLQAVEVMGDGSLLFALLNALMDWALASTHSSIDLRIDLSPWPTKARLVCRFAHRSLDLMEDPREMEPPPALNSLAWRLVEQTALTMGVLPLREDDSGITVLTLEFPHTVGDEPGQASAPNAPLPPAPSDPEDDDDGEHLPSQNSKPLAGSHVLIVSPRRELRSQLQDAVRHMGLMIDVVNTMDEAAQFCLEGLPHAIIFEAAQRNEGFEHLRADLLREVPEFCFVEVRDDEHLTQLSTATADSMARISRQHLHDALPSVLLFELSRSL